MFHVKIAFGLKPGLKISTPYYVTSHNDRYAMTETMERIVLASRPVGEPTLDNFRSENLRSHSPDRARCCCARYGFRSTPTCAAG
jgi:hypothetical protein